MTSEMRHFHMTIKNGTIAAQARPAAKGYEVSRLSHHGDWVNLGRLFSPKQVEEIDRWLCNSAKLPTWNEWQQFLRSAS